MRQPLSCVIIEDEIKSQNLLKSIITEYCPHLKLEGIASCNKTALSLTQEKTPDLIFLDVELADGKCFALLENLDIEKSKIIFTTGYDQFALKAFDYNAVDYVLKPYSPKTIIRAVERAAKILEKEINHRSLSSLIENNKKKENKLQIHNHDGMHLIDVLNISYCEASQSYCNIYVGNNQEKIVSSKPLAEIEKKINSHRFSRPHKSYLVNLDHIKQISNQDGGYVVLKDGNQVPISRRYKQGFLENI